jgi:hypothetical protein
MQGRLLRGGGYRACNIRLSFSSRTLWDGPSRQMGIDEQQKFSDLDLIS